MNRIFRGTLRHGGLAACFVLLASPGAAQAVAPVAPVAPSQQQQQQRSAAHAVLPGFFGTIPVRVSAQRFWSEWGRARRDASAVPQMRRLIAAAVGLPRPTQIAYVQTAVARRIGWRSDATLYGRHDYWASAEETLRHGRGDMEDRAIVKMQALRALGFPTRDLYLTLGRDSVGGPQAVLIVRLGNAYYVLDDTGGPPYTPSDRPEFKPLFTFGWGASWVHMSRGSGRTVAAADSNKQVSAGSGGE